MNDKMYNRCYLWEVIDCLAATGWQEVVPVKGLWRYIKNGWLCIIDWYGATAQFYPPGE